MGSITSVVIFAAYVPPGVREKITTESYKGGGERLGNLSDDWFYGNPIEDRRWGGSKISSIWLYGAGFNYFIEEDFLKWLNELPWGAYNKEGVTVIMHYEPASDAPKVVNLKDVHFATTG